MAKSNTAQQWQDEQNHSIENIFNKMLRYTFFFSLVHLPYFLNIFLNMFGLKSSAYKKSKDKIESLNRTDHLLWHNVKPRS